MNPMPAAAALLSTVLFVSPALAADAPYVRQDPAVLKQDLRKLWTDHVVWTRSYVVATVAGTADADAALARLMTNQEDIGRALAGHYGEAAGSQVTMLLKEHISIAGEVVKAAKAGDRAAQQQADAKWQRNAVAIVDTLCKVNPTWSHPQLINMMKMHLQTTTDQVVARLQKRWDADVRAYDAVYAHALKMSDVLSDGIIQQFPDRFVRPMATSSQR